METIITLIAAFGAAFLGGRMAVNASIVAVREQSRLQEMERESERQERIREQAEQRYRIFTRLADEFSYNAAAFAQSNFIVKDVWITLETAAADAASSYMIDLDVDLQNRVHYARRAAIEFNTLATHYNLHHSTTLADEIQMDPEDDDMYFEVFAEAARLLYEYLGNEPMISHRPGVNITAP